MAIAAIRFNNPGNVSLPIRGYNGPGEVVGIRGQSGYASFPTVQDGLNAQSIRLQTYITGGVNGSGPLTSIAALNSRYAEDTNWKNAVSRFSGIGVNEQLDPNNAAQMSALQGGIIRQETGLDPSRFGLGTASPMNTNDPLQYTSPGGFDQKYYGDAGNGAIVSQTNNADGSADVVLGDDSGGVGTGLGGTGDTPISASNFSSQSFAGTSGAGSFGLSGIQSGGSPVNTGLASGAGAGTGSAAFGGTQGQPFGGAQGSGAASGAGSGDPVVGYNSAGPVIGASTVVGAINTSGAKVSGSVDKGAKQIGDDTKEAGKTIGQSVTGLSSQLKGISDSWQALGKDYFIRLAFIVVGLIALAAALLMFKPVQSAVAGVATRIPKVPV